MLKTFTSLVFILSLAAISFAQTAPAAKPTPTPEVIEDDGEVLKIDSKLVVVPVSVTDARGMPVTGLKITDFRLLEDGKAQQLAEISPADEVPLEIALLIDISSSIDPLFESEKRAAAQFLKDIMRPNDRASVFTVGTRPFLYQPRDTAEKAAERIAGITIRNAVGTDGKVISTSTAFYDSVIMAADYLRKNSPQASRRVIVLISDGEDTSSEVMRNSTAKEDLLLASKIGELTNKKRAQIAIQSRTEARNKVKDKILRSMQDGDTVFYSINPAGNSYQLNIPSVFGQETMSIFADQTGGSAFLLKKETDLDLIFRQLTSELRAQYLLQYYTDSPAGVGAFVPLQVSVPGAAQPRIRARKGYFVKK